MYCRKCGALISEEEKFCGSCGEPLNNPVTQQDEQQTAPLQDEQQTAQPIQQKVKKTNTNFRPVCLVVIIICAILWLFAPFVAVNLLTLGEQPTALQFLTDDIAYVGNLANSAAFWAAIGSMIGIIVCFICIIARKNTATRVVAIITEIPMALALVEILGFWVSTGFFGIFDTAGIGYWGILVLLIVVAVS